MPAPVPTIAAMYPGSHAERHPDKPAVIMATSGEVLTYAQLDAGSNRLAQLWHDAGLRRGDHIALFMENQIRFMEVAWAALRSGLYLTAINSFLTAPEVAYILEDCEAKAVVSSTAKAEVIGGCDTTQLASRLMVGGAVADGFTDYAAATSAYPTTPLADESLGFVMLYSSGTTGRPKGIKRPMPAVGLRDKDPVIEGLKLGYGFRNDMAYLSPAPMYHAAPLGFVIWTQRIGGTAVIMERFDAAQAVELIERHHVTHSQWVPTMFIRMLRLPDDQRLGHDLSSHETAIHAAAPCPVPVKRQMIEWWGPILYEYYAGTEGNGSTYITSTEWLAHPGSVGKARIGQIHILDEEGNELGPGEEGTIWFSGGGTFEYHNDPVKTAESRRDGGLSTLGDVGYLDAEGYLYLTDRKAFMIIAGGVNIYPREIEDVIVTHPQVADVAVFGVPDEDLGEAVKAVVQPIDGVEPSPELAESVLALCRSQLARFKVPRSIDFEAELPRLPTGKLYKRLLRDRYLGKTDSTIV
jgi:acyl-CoA synthetase (AMP-forming)/AMP-acid ligase II